MSPEQEKERQRIKAARRYADPETRAKILERRRERGPVKSLAASRARKAADQRRYRKDPALQVRLLARGATKAAVAAGRLTKSPCTVCGTEKVEAHHEDYSRPLWVIWLCRKHHKALHRKYDTPQSVAVRLAIAPLISS